MSSDTKERARAALAAELKAAASAFSRDEAEAAAILETMAEDVRRAMAEPITIFPVIHHSPASAVQMARWLQTSQPRLVLIELCEDLLPLVEHLRDCTLPVALQAFAGQPVGFPAEWAPLSVVAPLTELSAEYQAIAYALSTEGVTLEFVDRSVDHVFQWRDPQEDPDAPEHDLDEEDEEAARLHGDALGIELGGVTPSFAEFREFLLANARMSHFSEWIALYVEGPTLAADTVAYREVLCMIGSLFRRLGSTPHRREEIRRRDRYMWTRIKEALARHEVAPEDAVFVCGAAHIVDDDVPEWGLSSDARWTDAPPRSETRWQYGFIPSSYGAIEMQFGHPRGAVAMAEAEWTKALKRQRLTPYSLVRKKTKKAGGSKGSSKGGAKGKRARRPATPEQLNLRSILRDSPTLTEADQDELIGWCASIVASARKNRYLASTADAIAIYETSVLLARLRARNRPSPYDFIDAAETCLEKTRVPGRRDIRQLCHRMLGGDRVGQVGYDSLPPLVQDVYDRLAVIGMTAQTRTVKRVLMDFDARPELRPVSRLLWRLHWMLPGTRVARPIMGELALGVTPRQESWDVRISGPEQQAVIQLAFQGVSVEQVLERRLHERAFDKEARTIHALEAAESCALLLDSARLFETLGDRAVALLRLEAGPDDAPEIFERVRRLVHHFRARPEGLPAWLERFVATGYAHYATLLPTAFADRGTSPAQLSAMLSFVFTLESLALAMGCQRSQLLIAVERAGAGTSDPEKLGLLWATEWLLMLRDEAAVRRSFGAILTHALGRATYPRYLSGFMQAMAFAPRVAPLAVELLGRAFEALPDSVLLPWMPGLLSTLGPLRGDVMPGLLKELTRDLPRAYPALEGWDAPWMKQDDATAKDAASDRTRRAAPSRSPDAEATHRLLRARPGAVEAHARGLGIEARWSESTGAEASGSGSEPPAPNGSPSEPHEASRLTLVSDHPAAAAAWAEALVG